ncbi:hypothetical protein LPJ68_006044, partial [Coemansia sp. RSA 1086]
MPDSLLCNGDITAEDVAQMDLATKCRLKRERLFEDSLLRKLHPKFYHEHFMKYPVLHINFSRCKGNTLGDFIVNIGGSIRNTVHTWLKEYRLQQKDAELPEFERLNRLVRTYERISEEPEDTAAKYKNLPLRMFEALSDFVAEVDGRYILLVDEYDIPFTSIYLAKWNKDDKQAARNLMKLLYQTMLKDNDNLIKGVLFGVFEVPLTEMGSGANNIKEIRMVPTDEKDIRASILTADCPHSRDGLDALTDSFWFNAKEVEQMLDQSTSWCAKVADYKMFIMDQIRE